MKLTKSKLRQIIREELLNEAPVDDSDYSDITGHLDDKPKKGDAILVDIPYEGLEIYGYKNKDKLKRYTQYFKSINYKPKYLVKVIKKL